MKEGIDKKKNEEMIQEFLNFMNEAKSPFAAVDIGKRLLLQNGFTQLKESEVWDLKKGESYFYVKGGSTLIAFKVGTKYTPDSGFNITAAHTDSPCLKLKPIGKIEKFEYKQVGVQVYGGGIWHTWFDRDLGLSGLVLVRSNGRIESRIINITDPIMFIPSLAIHLDGSANDAFKFNRETNFTPIISTSRGVSNTDSGNNHHEELIDIIAKEAGCKPEDICGLDLSLCDVQDSVLGGVNKEFIISGRLDNLMMSYCCLKGLMEAENDENNESVYMCALFDHEEIGSTSSNGANSNTLETTMKRVASSIANNQPVDLSVPISKSIVFSCDMAHSVHPNYGEKHESNHRPLIQQGPVLKINSNQRYATTSETGFIVKEIALKNNVPLQEFVIRNDSSGGSTVGPILSAKLGIRCVDLGLPQLAMHSIREIAGTQDLIYGTKLAKGFYTDFTSLDKQISLD